MNLIERLQEAHQARPLVMGILNVTPDSFSDGGQFVSKEAVIQQVVAMTEAGADIIDVGGESTRPGAEPVPLQMELDRVMPAIEWVKQYSDAYVSVDTYKPEVMQQALRLSVDLINDINALEAEGAMALVSQSDVAVCLMHKSGDPQTMQSQPDYPQGVFDAVYDYLSERARACEMAGIQSSAILLDPGFGFGKNLSHNVTLFERLEEFTALNYPLLVGVSRKRMIGELLGELPVDKRLVGSVAAASLAAMKGAKVVRVHDVAETVQALEVTLALL
ncbi:MAG: dihydropteroate synthase [Hydrogenovibrio sp.]